MSDDPKQLAERVKEEWAAQPWTDVYRAAVALLSALASLETAEKERVESEDELAAELAGERILHQATMAERDRYREALEFYAAVDNWTQPTSWGGRLFDEEAQAVDCGQRARAALSSARPTAEMGVDAPDFGPMLGSAGEAAKETDA